MNEIDRRRRIVSPARRREVGFTTRRRTGDTGSESSTPGTPPGDLGMDSIWNWNNSAVIEKATTEGEVING